MPLLQIDDRTIDVPDGFTILEAARKAAVEVPTLCYYSSLSPYGACRVCQVEVVKNGLSRLVASCVTPAEEKMVVKSRSEAAIRARKMVVEMLLARCPSVPAIQELARDLGVARGRFAPENHDCILCGLCVRACREIVGADAISLVNRGPRKEVGSPFNIMSSACISCGTCLTICPLGTHKLEEMDSSAIMHTWKQEIKRRKCKVCASFNFQPAYAADYASWLGEGAGGDFCRRG